MDERRYFTAQERKSDRKVTWEYGRLLRFAGLRQVDGWGVLDAGCGAGPGLRFVVAQGGQAYGVDASAYALGRAHDLVPEARLVRADLTTGLPLSSGSFHLVVLADVIEHLAQSEQLLRECRRVLRPGGVLLVRTVNRWDVRRYWQGTRWSGVADAGHVHLFSPPELREALQRAGFVRVRVHAGVKPMFWLPMRWLMGVPWPPLVGNGLAGVGRCG